MDRAKLGTEWMCVCHRSCYHREGKECRDSSTHIVRDRRCGSFVVSVGIRVVVVFALVFAVALVVAAGVGFAVYCSSSSSSSRRRHRRRSSVSTWIGCGVVKDLSCLLTL